MNGLATSAVKTNQRHGIPLRIPTSVMIASLVIPMTDDDELTTGQRIQNAKTAYDVAIDDRAVLLTKPTRK